MIILNHWEFEGFQGQPFFSGAASVHKIHGHILFIYNLQSRYTFYLSTQFSWVYSLVYSHG